MAEETPTTIQDCIIIARAFEKGANHAMTEESVFAVLTPRLSTMRSVSKTTKKSMSTKASETQSPALLGLTSGDADAIDLLKECFPCKFRIDFKGKMSISQLLSPSGPTADPILEALKDFYTKALSEINEVLDMFRNLDKYVDLCAFKKFFTEFVCVPDLQRILALLTAFLMKLALELNNIFSMVISLFGPLLMPFLSGLVDQLTQFILAAIKPIECVIENIQRMLTKLDYNTLFQNIDSLKVSLGPKQGKPEKPVDIKFPIVGTVAQTQDAGSFDKRGRSLEFNLNPLGKGEANRENKKVAEAENELDALQKASEKIDGSNQAQGDANRKQITAAKDKVDKAKREREKSVMGKANQEIGEQFQSMKGSLVSMLAMLRRAASEIEAYIRKVLDELVKLIREFFGGGASEIALLADKLQIVQLIALIVAIIKALKNKTVCEDEGQENEVFTNMLNTSQGFTMYTDEDGTVHIQEKDDGVQRAIEDVAKAFGVPPDGDPNEKLKSLVKFTGNDTLDSSISRAVDAITVPMRVKFKCPLQTSVANAETVNKWIRELNSESI